VGSLFITGRSGGHVGCLGATHHLLFEELFFPSQLLFPRFIIKLWLFFFLLSIRVLSLHILFFVFHLLVLFPIVIIHLHDLLQHLAWMDTHLLSNFKDLGV
jgi:hypothetical protein